MKKILLPVLFAVLSLSVIAQKKFSAGIYLGAGFAAEKSDYSNISILPIAHGGFNFHLGVHLNCAITKALEFETGVQKVTKGYEYTNTTTLSSQYNKSTTLSVPAMLLVHIVNYPEELPIRISLGAGAYGSYAISGKVIDENGSSSNATFSNSNRFEIGPRLMTKVALKQHFEAYVATDLPSTNTVKNGSGYVKQGSTQVGFGWIF
ncbi:MAG: outer membrane beta-barrel protein [Bacteroidetes bacterium]|nr:outer membrane beta-barrel protein [Bacteroidota bacterium]